MNYEILNPIRNFTRVLGINKLISKLSYNNYYNSLVKNYNIEKPNIVTITSNELSIQMNIDSFSEYERVMSFKKDEKILHSILTELKKNKDAIFWDIGTNIGLYSLLAAKASGSIKQVISFEPEPRCIERIKANYTLNNLKNIKIYPLALSDTEGVLSLNVNQEFGAGNHSIMNKEVSTGQSFIEVKVETGNNIIQKYKEEIPTIIKIDVEGAEIKVLEGMSTILAHKDCKALMCEVHFTVLNQVGYKNGAKEIINILKKHSFSKFDWVDSSHLFATK